MGLNAQDHARRIRETGLPYIKKLEAIILGSLFAAVLSSASAATLHRGVSTEPTTLDPHYVVGNTGATVILDLFEGLLVRDADGRIASGAAESWSVSEDRTVYAFTLRDQLVWSDGTPLTADDFVYSFKRVADPANATRAARFIGPIKNAAQILARKANVDDLGVRAIDERTLRIELAEPVSYFDEFLSNAALAPVPGHVIEKHDTSWTAPENIVVNGPYTLVERVTNSHLKVARNDLFHDAAAVQIDEVYYYPIEKPSMGLLRFRGNELDILRSVPTDRIDWISENYPGQLHRDPIASLAYVLLNHDTDRLKDVRARRALSISIDRSALTDLLIKDSTGPAYNLVPPQLSGYGKRTPRYADQPLKDRQNEARELLAAAGYSSENPLVIELKFAGDEKGRRTAVALQAMWKQVGAQVEIANVGGPSVGQHARNGNYQAMRYLHFAPFLDPIAFLNLIRTDHLSNFSRYSNHDFDRLLSEAGRIYDREARLEQLRQAEDLAMADFPVIPLFFRAQFTLLSKRVEGWRDDLRGNHPTRYLRIAEEYSALSASPLTVAR